jgi:hypothetical protein
MLAVKRFLNNIRLAGILTLLLALPVSATLVRYLPLEEQAHTAAVVVVAVAGGQNCVWGSNSALIYTDTQFRVEEWVKGQDAGGNLTTRQLGGVIGEMGQRVAGTPVFRTGSRYVLFLAERGDGRYRVVGFSQGAYPVVRSVWGAKKVMPSLAAAEGTELVGIPGKDGSGDEGGSGKNLPLGEFLTRIRTILGEE